MFYLWGQIVFFSHVVFASCKIPRWRPVSRKHLWKKLNCRSKWRCINRVIQNRKLYPIKFYNFYLSNLYVSKILTDNFLCRIARTLVHCMFRNKRTRVNFQLWLFGKPNIISPPVTSIRGGGHMMGPHDANWIRMEFSLVSRMPHFSWRGPPDQG